MNTTPKTPRATGLCMTAAATAVLLVAGAAPSSATEGGKGRPVVVHPGQSIQAAVDQAAPGATIRIRAGEYHEAVCVDGKGLTIRGAGADKTIIKPPAEFAATACWDAPEEVSGIQFNYPVDAHGARGSATVKDLQTQDHPSYGIGGLGVDGFTVERTKGVGHGLYGVIATAGSSRITITDNVEEGTERVTEFGVADSGTAGISVGDSAEADARVEGNTVSGWNLGIFARESRGGLIADNTVSNNCVGVLVFDDAATELPDTVTNIIGGDWDVVGNSSTANNRLCYAGRDGSLIVSGIGMQVTNADDVLVQGNTITGNFPVVPDGVVPNSPPGGLSVLSLPSPTGGADPGQAENIRVIENTFRDNAPFDITELDFGFFPGEDGNVYEYNDCTTSLPADICGS